MTSVTVVVGAQFGSEGKGAVVGKIARQFGPRDVVIRVAGPNAGHTAYDDTGREWKLRSVPVAAVTSRDCQLHIAAGSEVDPLVLADEVTRLNEAGFNVSDRLTVHPSATILEGRHIGQEGESGIVHRIGSTGKGIGAARADRIARTANLAGVLYHPYPRTLSEPGPFDLTGVEQVIVEGTQGYGLGLHTGFYPKVTSSDCRAIDFLAMAGISPWAHDVDLQVILVARVYPIRVAGNSGPLKGETSWAALDLPNEHTTVTNKVRRVGTWDLELVREAIRANGGGDWNDRVTLALTMLDQLFPAVSGLLESEAIAAHRDAADWLDQLEDTLETEIGLVGTGPNTMVVNDQ